jgi:hypothetical protein
MGNCAALKGDDAGDGTIENSKLIRNKTKYHSYYLKDKLQLPMRYWKGRVRSGKCLKAIAYNL